MPSKSFLIHHSRSGIQVFVVYCIVRDSKSVCSSDFKCTTNVILNGWPSVDCGKDT